MYYTSHDYFLHYYAPIVAEGNLTVLMHHPDNCQDKDFLTQVVFLASLTSYRVVSWVIRLVLVCQW